jgi:hypothetical protein
MSKTAAWCRDVEPRQATSRRPLHRFSISPAPERTVTSTPTFLIAAGLPGHTLLGVHYASNSELSPRYPNEWELFGRVAPITQGAGSLIDASAQVGYNLAAEGLDAEAAVMHTVSAEDGSFDSGPVEPGDPTAGEFPYHCEPHPFMTGRVIVE